MAAAKAASSSMQRSKPRSQKFSLASSATQMTDISVQDSAAATDNNTGSPHPPPGELLTRSLSSSKRTPMQTLKEDETLSKENLEDMDQIVSILHITDFEF